jgi:hypothetical protein
MVDHTTAITLYKAKILGLMYEALALANVEQRLVAQDEAFCGPGHQEMAASIWLDRGDRIQELIDELVELN